MESTYHYYAFVSYATTDSKWAKWLQHQLSYYHIPSAVRKSKIGVPQKIRPIFIYEYDLAGNQLHQAIEQELSASKYLIVICSPSAAKSKYVNREVETFIKQGRQEYIIPFIVEGEVNASNPDDECFPPALRELMQGDNLELRGANIATNGKRQALVDIVATMLGVRRDLLWNRYKARQMKQRMTLAAMAVIAMLFGLFYWGYTRPTYKYYADYVDVWGVPKGVIELDKEQVKHRNRSYRFEKRRIPFGQPNAYDWRLAKVTHIKSASTPVEITETAYNDRYPIMELVYSPQNGNITDIVYCDTKGKKQLSHKLSKYNGVEATIVDIESAVTGEASAFAKGITTIMSEDTDRKTRITRYVYTRDAEGYITKVTYHANNDVNLEQSAVADNNAVWGIEYELDSLGRRIRVQYLNKDGSYFSNKIGVSTRCYQYDYNGGICIETSFDINGDPILNEYLTAKTVRKYNAEGNRSEQSFFGIDGTPCLYKDSFAKVVMKYDDRGNYIEEAYYGKDGKPCLSKNGVAKVVMKYDDRGNSIEEALYGIDGKPCLNKNGVAKVVWKYDDRGNTTESAYYGIDGKPCLHKDGFAKVVSKYDNRGNRTEQAYYGTDGKPCLDKDGYAKVVMKYDDRGNLTEWTYYGIDGKPCLNQHGVAKVVIKYDDQGNTTEQSYYGIDNELCVGPFGYAKATVSDSGEVTFYDENGNDITNKFTN